MRRRIASFATALRITAAMIASSACDRVVNLTPSSDGRPADDALHADPDGGIEVPPDSGVVPDTVLTDDASIADGS